MVEDEVGKEKKKRVLILQTGRIWQCSATGGIGMLVLLFSYAGNSLQRNSGFPVNKRNFWPERDACIRRPTSLDLGLSCRSGFSFSCKKKNCYWIPPGSKQEGQILGYAIAALFRSSSTF